jgi:hypothetical protein
VSLADALPFCAPLEDYERQAEGLLRALKEGDDAARWRFKWEHDRFRGRHVNEVRVLVERGARLDLKDTIYDGTPLDWATYGERTAIAEYLRGAA